MTPTKPHYDVFISSKSEDYLFAEEVYDFLEANGVNCFLDKK
ncbi:MAG: toll/interleukin-1 receptor domain-containing protein [Victivallales bacterium]|nr:toll/interleukin-1 receptor domain-containing protein [Victivallales bacterium]